MKIQCRLDRKNSNNADACNIINGPETDHSAITSHTMASRLQQNSIKSKIYSIQSFQPNVIQFNLSNMFKTSFNL